MVLYVTLENREDKRDYECKKRNKGADGTNV